ncbi:MULTISPECIES: hypothetical protein [Exiguobacterium]|uniref:Camelysin metallo-endopeptidase n=1 Tax=Exiguobacterium undae TaxID=169177 RepID=A0ABX2V4V0_9BACL|nr:MULTISPECIES: hypothetical protein [Exiguobacterium]OAN10093.1 hypothetical protein A3783_15085 [Exiguobacterium undae]
MKAKKITAIVGLAGILGLGTFYLVDQNESASGKQVSSIQKADLKKVTMTGDFAMDVTKTTSVVGNSENVFIAKVEKEISHDETLPSTQFQVTIVKNVKGELSEEQVVNQNAGIFDDNGEKVLLTYEDQEMLVPGKTYLFATIHDEKTDWHNPVPAYGEVLLEDGADIQTVADTYETAFENQTISPIMERHDELELEEGFVEEEAAQ